ncbi:MAG: phenylalanine--tRNA ligase subunit beta [Acidimicrobiia bacterium]|nr:phenylalanine--tRNA ligase subunit beta [Acidimicrobiia bacterium]
MRVLLSWMRDFAQIEGDPEYLADQMTDLGMVVEAVETVGPSWDGIVVAKVLALSEHPEADRIQLVSVDAGDGEPLQICCGAFNMAVDDLVPLATIGTVMPGGLEIGRRKLRGEWSNGMICSAAELELGDDAEGILILDRDLTVGDDLATALGAETDVLFDLDIEGNRPDALSVAGVARDLAARLGVPFSLPSPSFTESSTVAADRSSVRLDDGHLCKRFGMRVLENVTIGDSPHWMVQRLTAAGVRSINSIVDISNYVMLELGQPNHTYDLGLVDEGALVVRMGRDGETITTLDDLKRQITDADGVIANGADEPIGLAGVMGGASTEISGSTTSVLLEAAIWDRMTIAKTSRRLGLRSEASMRFERGVDPEGVELALDRFAELAVEICGARVASGAVIVDGDLEPTPPVALRVDRVNMLLNTSLTAAEIAAYLDPIGFTVTAATEAELTVTVPSWRPDCSEEIDVVEEVARHHGYDKSGLRVPTPIQAGELTPAQKGRRHIRRSLEGAGFSETMPIPFLAPGDLERAGLPDDGISLANPLVAEESVLRTSLLPGLLKVIAYNQAHRADVIRPYELGRVYAPAEGDLPDERELVAAAEAGFDAADDAAVHATRLLHRLAAELGLQGLTVRNAGRPGLHPTRSAEVVFRGQTIGEVGEVDPEVLERYEVSGRVAWLQLEVEPVLTALETVLRYIPISRFPSSDVDLAFVVADAVPATDVARTLRSAGGALLRSVRLFDTYRSEQLGEGVRSLAYGLRFQADDRTLTDGEVAEARQACIDAVIKHHDGVLR